MSTPGAGEVNVLRELADRGEISDVINRYADGVRLRDLELLMSCFDDGATLDYGKDQVVGLPNIRAFFGANRGIPRVPAGPGFALDVRAVSTPVMANIVIEIDGDVAHCESMCLAIHAGYVEGDGSVIVRGTRNVDELTRTDLGWRIRHRTHQTLWSFQLPGTPVVEPE